MPRREAHLRSIVLGALAELALTACAAPADTTVEPPLEPVTGACLTGVWRGEVRDFGPGRNCPHCELSLLLATHECDALDCVEANVVVYREDGVHFTGLWRWSEDAGTMSFVADYCPPPSYPWRVDEPGTLIIDRPLDTPDTIRRVDCSSVRLVYDGDRRATHVREGPGFTTGVLGMLERSECVSATFDPT